MTTNESDERVAAWRPTADLSPLSMFAEEIREDIFRLYGCPVPAMVKKAEEKKLNLPECGQLIVVATRSKQLGDELLLRLSYQVAIGNRASVAIYSVNDSPLVFTRKLLGSMAHIHSDTAFYDDSLNKAELERLSSALVELAAAEIFMYQIQQIWLNWLCFSILKMNQVYCGHIGMVLIDGVQRLIDNRGHRIDTQQSLVTLKGLADRCYCPLVVLYQLDSTIDDSSSTLTQSELAEIENLSGLSDGLVLMSGTRENLIFSPPGITNAKPVGWLDQIVCYTT